MTDLAKLWRSSLPVGVLGDGGDGTLEALDRRFVDPTYDFRGLLQRVQKGNVR